MQNIEYKVWLSTDMAKCATVVAENAHEALLMFKEKFGVYPDNLIRL